MTEHLHQPAFEVPLSERELILVGRITIAFGQIDEFLTWLICSVHGITQEQYNAFLKDRMLSARVQALADGTARIPDAATKAIVEGAVAALKAIIPDRNLVTHGCWGRFTADYVDYRVGPFSRTKPKQRFYAEQLEGLHDRACAASVLMVQCLARFNALVEPNLGDPVPPSIIWTTANGPPDSGYHAAGSVALPVPDPTQG
ncbi:hypothetical protein ACOYW6_01480 [Parablastomonas sp. CN1-191]|uniref:hypothetical protein n=1 Tax=Parablastomonas sp. CN1-191 TaxID=3400908 RepID=UPI003BF7CE09